MSKLNAKDLAKKPYTIVVYEDKTTTGEKIYLATHPELSGCMAQGETQDSAIKELESVTIEYIDSLIEDNLPIPEPFIHPTVATNSGEVTITDDSITIEKQGIMDSSDFPKDLEKTIQSSSRQWVATLVAE